MTTEHSEHDCRACPSGFSKLYSCPRCRHPLAVESVKGGFDLWCANGRCDSEAANRGHWSKTEAQSFRLLVEDMDNEDREYEREMGE